MEGHYVAMTGGMSIGMIGYNINIANVIAAMFTACGQDIACVHESSLGHLSMKASPGRSLRYTGFTGLGCGNRRRRYQPSRSG